jgi:hypothetical protein
MVLRHATTGIRPRDFLKLQSDIRENKVRMPPPFSKQMKITINITFHGLEETNPKIKDHLHLKLQGFPESKMQTSVNARIQLQLD